MKIVVIGGSGLIGSKLVRKLSERAHEAMAASPDSGVNTLTGEGLDEALEGASVVVDVSNSPSFADAAVMEFFTTSTGNLLAAEAAAGVAHHVALSVVGTERRVVFQAAFANVNPRAVTKVDFHKDDRPPLLIMGNDQDHTIPASVSKEAAMRLAKSKAVVDYKQFSGRPHFPAAPGWEAVADYALDWATRHVGAPGRDGRAGEDVTAASSDGSARPPRARVG